MFEHFGAKDLFIGIWKKKYYILLFSIAVTVLGAGAYIYRNSNTNQPTYSSSATYYIKDKVIKENGQVFGANTYASMMQADFCKEYVLKHIDKEHIDKWNLSIQILKELVHINILGDGRSINFFVESLDESFSKDLLNAYKSYVDEVLIEQFEQEYEAEYIGGVNQVIQNTKSNTAENIKIGFGIFFGCIILYSMIIFIKILFYPTINRKRDFEEFSIPVLGEIKDEK